MPVEAIFPRLGRVNINSRWYNMKSLIVELNEAEEYPSKDIYLLWQQQPGAELGLVRYGVLYQRLLMLTLLGPFSRSDGCDSFWHGDQAVPGSAGGVENVVTGVEDAVG